MKDKKRKIKSLSVFRCNLNENKYRSAWYIYRQSDYRKDGLLTKEIIFSENGNIRAEINFQYRGKKLKNKKITYPQSEQSEEYIYTYDKGGREIEQIKMQNDKLYDRFTKRYDEEGKLLESVHYDEKNDPFAKETYEYSGDLRTKEIHFNEKNEPELEILFEYNQDGKVTKEINNNISEKAAELTHYTYDDLGSRIHSETIDLAGNITGTVHINYDKKGNAIKYLSETFGISHSRMINQVGYDDEDQPVLNEFYDVLSGALILQERVKYNDNGDIAQEELYEVDMKEEGTATHHILQMAYEYYA